VLPVIDRWLLAIFAPHRLTQTIRQMQATQDPAPAVRTSSGHDPDALIASCDTRLARYQAALDAGADPKAVAEWTRQVQAERATILARAASQDRHQPARSPKTTFAPWSPASATCTTSSATPNHR